MTWNDLSAIFVRVLGTTKVMESVDLSQEIGRLLDVKQVNEIFYLFIYLHILYSARLVCNTFYIFCGTFHNNIIKYTVQY